MENARAASERPVATHRRVWLLTLALSIGSLGVWTLALPGLGPLSSGFAIPWWVIALAFIATESWVVHLHFRSESGTFSFYEITLVLGLLFTAPTHVWFASVLASFVALRFIRKQPWIKIAFNLANQSLHVGIAAIGLHFALDGVDVLAPAGWLAILTVTVLSGSIEMVAIATVIALAENTVEWRRIGRMLAFGAVVSSANTTQALIAALLLVTEPYSVVLLIGTTLVLFVAYRAYFSERDHRERVEFLYNSTRVLRESDEMDGAISSLLTEASSMFRAGAAELFLFPAPDTEQELIHYELSGTATVVRREADRNALVAKALAELAPEAILLPRNLRTGATGEYLGSRAYGDVLLGTLQTDQRAVAVLIVGNRLGDVSGFTADDLRLFETLVEHSAVALENDQLEQTLSQLRRLERELAHQASHDGLTGLANRTLLMMRLDDELANGARVALLYIDLDDFKVVNDTMGHAAGDLLLKETAQRITDCIRPTDMAARLGGDEFAVMLADSDDPEHVARRILDSLDAPFLLADREARVGVSIGVVASDNDAGASVLLGQADVAMYAAKERGKGNVALFQPNMQDNLSRQQWLRADLRTAIDRDEFFVLYQPIVDLGRSTVVGAEALVRWNTSTGIVPPGQFIEEAERAGLILPIDRFVLDSVLRDVALLDPDKTPPGFFLSANLSARHFYERDLVDRLASTVLASGVGSTALVLEITETALVRDAISAIDQLQAIRAMGIRIALDDFGTGYSSLSHLRRLPIDILKIAQPFVGDIDAAGDDSFVRAIIGLGHTLDIEVLAEGIETDHQRSMLAELDCDLGQGFVIARPMPFDDLQSWIARRGAGTPS